MREADSTGLATYTERIGRHANLATMLREMSESEERWHRTLEARASELVQALYWGLFGHEPETKALESGIADLSRTHDVGLLLTKMASSDAHWRMTLEARAPEVVRAVYQGLLKREPAAEALATNSSTLAQNRDLVPLLTEISCSNEHWHQILLSRAPELIRALYKGLLDREPEAEALAGYASILAQTGNLVPLLAEISRSDEHWHQNLRSRAPELIRALYKGLLGREPEIEALAGYVSVLAQTGNLVPLLAEISRSDEHWHQNLRSRAPELIRALYKGLLGREPETEALAGYVSVLAQTGNLAPLLAEISSSNEHWHQISLSRAPELIRALYKGLLDREPEAKALECDAAFLAQTNDLSQLIANIVRSEEHWNYVLALRAREVIQVIYKAMLGRDVYAFEMQTHARAFAKAQGFGGVLNAICHSKEFMKAWRDSKCNIHPGTTYGTKTLVFLHIQKTGGTSVRRMLRDIIPQAQFFDESSDSLHKWAPAELSRYSIFAGHWNFDSLAYIHRQALTRLTFVREPKSRLISLYYFLRAHEPSHPEYSEGMDLANKLPIADFFAHGNIRYSHGLWNHMTWVVMGARQWTVWRSMLLAERDERVIAKFLQSVVRKGIRLRIREFAFVGLQEEFSRSMGMLCHVLQLPHPKSVRKDHGLVTLMKSDPHFRSGLRKRPMSVALSKALDGLIQLDNIVYEEARKYNALLWRRIQGELARGERVGTKVRARVKLV